MKSSLEDSVKLPKRLTHNRLSRLLRTLSYPSYLVFFVTARCNARCKMCFYADNMAKGTGPQDELSVEEYGKIARSIKLINVLGISGGEPFIREDLAEIVNVLYTNCAPLVLDLPTNGFFVESILRQTEAIARSCPRMVVDLQLSIDGPETIHNEMRGLKDGFHRLRDAYRGLVALKTRYRNLHLKACVVYSHYNEQCMDELFGVLKKDFKSLDRVVFSVVHGSVSNREAFDFSWDSYFRICDRIRKASVVRNTRDLHSVFTIALRMVKNDFLKEVLTRRDMYRNCGAGRKVIVINERGKVFPCEPLWFPIGDLRENGYDLGKVLNSKEMDDFRNNMMRTRCNCHWGLPLSNALLYAPRYYPRIAKEILSILRRSMLRHNHGLLEIPADTL